MKRFLVLLLFSSFFGGGFETYGANIDIKLRTDRSKFLLYEPAFFEVSIVNNHDGLIHLRHDVKRNIPWLNFVITNEEGQRVDKDNDLALKNEVLLAGQSTTVPLNITPYFNLRKSGSYKIQAVVSVEGMTPFITSSLDFDIIKGQAVWKQERLFGGVEREYRLVKFSDRKDTKLYIEVSEPESNIIYGAFSLGKFVAFSEPKTMFDVGGNLHVLHSFASRAYRYTKIDPKGKILGQESRASGASLPDIALDQAGEVSFVGGVKPEDFQREKLSKLQQGGNVPSKLPNLQQ